jgi:BolA protein
MSTSEIIKDRLTAALSPARLSVVDESHHHVGHAGHRPEGETHFRVEIVSAAFEGKTRVERQRMVYALLAEQLSADLHALALKTITPAEDVAPSR